MKNYASAVIKSLAVKAIVSNHKLFRKKKKPASGAKVWLNASFRKIGSFFSPQAAKEKKKYIFIADQNDQITIFLIVDQIKFNVDISCISLIRGLHLAQLLIMPVVGQLSLH